jgi:hypothetical protein
MALPFTLKKYLNAKEELWKFKYFTMQKKKKKKTKKKKKKSSIRNQNPSRYYNFVTNLKFQHKPKYHLSKNNPHIKINRPIIIIT